ncbi:hypothetical protein AMTRI_Chr03g53560 [Amborella trichopoda]
MSGINMKAIAIANNHQKKQQRARTDDDLQLELFRDVKAASVKKYLYPYSSDDIDRSICGFDSERMRDFSNVLTVSTKIVADKSSLLNLDLEKNEFNWLLTPPDTPLFASLDSEPAAVRLNLGHRTKLPNGTSRGSSRFKPDGVTSSLQNSSTDHNSGHRRSHSSAKIGSSKEHTMPLTSYKRSSSTPPSISSPSSTNKSRSSSIRRSTSTGKRSTSTGKGLIERNSRSQGSSPELPSAHLNNYRTAHKFSDMGPRHRSLPSFPCREGAHSLWPTSLNHKRIQREDKIHTQTRTQKEDKTHTQTRTHKEDKIHTRIITQKEDKTYTQTRPQREDKFHAQSRKPKEDKVHA